MPSIQHSRIKKNIFLSLMSFGKCTNCLNDDICNGSVSVLTFVKHCITAKLCNSVINKCCYF